ncbi:MAG: efflux transporter outer membrane subunit [Candidatus Acidiferrales bacterium]
MINEISRLNKSNKFAQTGLINVFMMRQFQARSRVLATCSAAILLFAGCTVGPKYHKPTADAPAAYKELTPADFSKTDGWKVAQPQDNVLHGKWWEMYNDPQLNALEEKVLISNQNIQSAMASYMAARALVKEARSQYFPTVTVGPEITESRQGAAASLAVTSGTSTFYSLPFDATWVPDLWGRVRNQVRANTAAAQASAADLENARLTAQAEVAVDYYQLRGQDDLKELLESTVIAYQQSLDLTKVLYETGIDSDESVAQAETQLESTEALDTNIGILRSQYEHAIAMLTGQPPSMFSIAAEPLKSSPPAIPFGVPSQLLERRPDIAANERLMEQANAQIGVAYAAYYPTLTLSASIGLESRSFTSWFTWPSRFFSAGPSLSETLYDGGLRRATVMQYRAQYDETVANYRQTVLTAFQQVEDNLASLRILSMEIQQQDTAVNSAERNLKIATDRYKLGIDPYLNVITAQTTLLTNQQTAVNLRMQQMTSSVSLIEALGGGLDTSQIPTPGQVLYKDSPPQPTP